jgi:hypothetical protein
MLWSILTSATIPSKRTELMLLSQWRDRLHENGCVPHATICLLPSISVRPFPLTWLKFWLQQPLQS